MGCSSGNSSGQLDDHDEEQQIIRELMDTRKRKRMISNRESARRSRMRKQKHMDDLKTLVNQLKDDNNQILANINITNQLYLNVEAENSILRAQISELTHRLFSLNDIIFNCSCYATLNAPPPPPPPPTTRSYNNISPLLETEDEFDDDLLNIPSCNLLNYLNHQPMIPCMATPDELMY